MVGNREADLHAGARNKTADFLPGIEPHQRTAEFVRSLMTASSGTSRHVPLTGTQYFVPRMSYSVSRPSASEQQKPFRLLSESNQV